jgi:hypothetical protein
MARTSGRFDDTTEAEFDLLRIRTRPTPTDISSYPFPANDDDFADDSAVSAPAAFDAPPGVVRHPSRPRQWAARFIGGALIAGAIYGVNAASARPQARQAMVEWVTLGHPEQARQAHERVLQWVNDTLHR